MGAMQINNCDAAVERTETKRKRNKADGAPFRIGILLTAADLEAFFPQFSTPTDVFEEGEDVAVRRSDGNWYFARVSELRKDEVKLNLGYRKNKDVSSDEYASTIMRYKPSSLPSEVKEDAKKKQIREPASKPYEVKEGANKKQKREPASLPADAKQVTSHKQTPKPSSNMLVEEQPTAATEEQPAPVPAVDTPAASGEQVKIKRIGAVITPDELAALFTPVFPCSRLEEGEAVAVQRSDKRWYSARVIELEKDSVSFNLGAGRVKDIEVHELGTLVKKYKSPAELAITEEKPATIVAAEKPVASLPSASSTLSLCTEGETEQEPLTRQSSDSTGKKVSKRIGSTVPAEELTTFVPLQATSILEEGDLVAVLRSSGRWTRGKVLTSKKSSVMVSLGNNVGEKKVKRDEFPTHLKLFRPAASNATPEPEDLSPRFDMQLNNLRLNSHTASDDVYPDTDLFLKVTSCRHTRLTFSEKDVEGTCKWEGEELLFTALSSARVDDGIHVEVWCEDEFCDVLLSSGLINGRDFQQMYSEAVEGASVKAEVMLPEVVKDETNTSHHLNEFEKWCGGTVRFGIEVKPVAAPYS